MRVFLSVVLLLCFAASGALAQAKPPTAEEGEAKAQSASPNQAREPGPPGESGERPRDRDRQSPAQPKPTAGTDRGAAQCLREVELDSQASCLAALGDEAHLVTLHDMAKRHAQAPEPDSETSGNIAWSSHAASLAQKTSHQRLVSYAGSSDPFDQRFAYGALAELLDRMRGNRELVGTPSMPDPRLPRLRQELGPLCARGVEHPSYEVVAAALWCVLHAEHPMERARLLRLLHRPEFSVRRAAMAVSARRGALSAAELRFIAGFLTETSDHAMQDAEEEQALLQGDVCQVLAAKLRKTDTWVFPILAKFRKGLVPGSAFVHCELAASALRRKR